MKKPKILTNWFSIYYYIISYLNTILLKLRRRHFNRINTSLAIKNSYANKLYYNCR